ncbi:NACHT domain-containing protein [Umezawaea sp. Da 62-37]|uniref:NACHT domain-containing protein n=1 Tax=Umezawaea sp. Da 62-37 TaxID=3075927 RepID=UPI0028F6C8DC|nr:NACHT domain-containing protein [Umezawaea sp. Da 62-37]WNV88353.1 NACHT domain-containing protein [Umezawaea sp. Da 62-37]
MDQGATFNQVNGNLTGNSLFAGSIQGDVHFHAVPPDAEVVRSPPPEGWGSLPVLPAEIQSLVRAQIQAAQELPYRLPGARKPSLATVYVRQDLGSATEEPSSEQSQPTPVLDSRGQFVDLPAAPIVRRAVRPPSRTVRDALDGSDNLLVTGGPGQGKSTLSLRLAADIATRLTAGGDDEPLFEPVIPLRLTARELSTRLNLPFSEALAGAVRVEYGALLHAPVDARTLADRVVGCRWLLLVDGLDEVADSAERDRLVTVLASWASESGESRYRVVVTTRPIEGMALAPLQRIGAARYELQPFDEEALRRFADSWFDDSADDAHRFIRQIRAAHLDELVRVPLLATIAAIVFAQHGERPLPDNQYELYDAYLKYLRTAHTSPPSPLDASRDSLLEHLGRVRLESDTSLVAAAHAWAVERLGPVDQEELFTFLTAVGPLTWRGNDLRFLHHSFAEHLAATAKARLLPERFTPEHEEFAHLLHTARLDDRGRHARAVLLHYCRLHPAQTDFLVKWLHKGDSGQHLLTARLLAGHVPAGSDAVDAFLTTVRAWAMTTQHPGRDILEQTARTAHHPGLAEWLAGLMRDGEAPWQSRVEAATALATRLRGPHSADAVTRLRETVDDVTATVEHRLAAAEGLSECGSCERETAERGLRAVLEDPLTSGWSCRTAAVVLAGFDGPARTHAVESLSRLLDDPWMPTGELVQIATALVEIGTEFHDRCAETFRAVLRSRGDAGNGFRGAASGLASLGAEHLAEAVELLTWRATTRRFKLGRRTAAAEALADLGPQHRGAAIKLVLAMAGESGVDADDRWNLASSLARFGGESHRHAEALVRSALVDRQVGANSRMWAARTLAGLGPDHHAEAARELREVVADPLAGGYDRAAALGQLAVLGEPHRTPAIAALRANLADRGADPMDRCLVADELVRLGPEFHTEVSDHLREVISVQSGIDVRFTAWQALTHLGIEFRGQASAALLDLMRTDVVGEIGAGIALTASDVDDPLGAADVLTAMIRDPDRSGRSRFEAIRSLVYLGRRFHPEAVAALVELLHFDNAPLARFDILISSFTGMGVGPRRELAGVLHDMALTPGTAADRVVMAAGAMDVLGHGDDPNVLDLLWTIANDESADVSVRSGAALAVCRVRPERHGDAVRLFVRFRHEPQYLWLDLMRDLVRLGASAVPEIRALLAEDDTDRKTREMAGSLLAQLHPDPVEAAHELHGQSSDEFLDFYWRTDAVMRLAEVDPDSVKSAITFHRAVLDDEREAVRNRAEAAYQLVWLDRSLEHVASTLLRRFAADPGLTAQEREHAVVWLSYIHPKRKRDTANSMLAVVHDPTVGHPVRKRLAGRLSGATRLDVERTLLADRTVPIDQRIPETGVWRSRPLEAVVRDVLAVVETRPAEKVAAAAALGRLAPRFVPEAAALLDDLCRRGYAVAARRELAKFGGMWCRRALVEARGVVDDKIWSRRERLAAARLLWEFAADARPLQDLVANEHLPVHAQADVLHVLKQFDRLRAIRDDERALPAIRVEAAEKLRDGAVRDRAISARVLDTVATDAAVRPALRRRAAAALGTFGARGREWGVVALRGITQDDTLPVIVRADAARALGRIRPDLRSEVLELLRGLLAIEKPLQRKQVLESIGLFAPAEGAFGLLEMANDKALGAVVRVRCAEEVVDLRRDYREAAAVVVREVAHDEGVPRQVRARAARDLARWSDLCRAEAQELLAGFV